MSGVDISLFRRKAACYFLLLAQKKVTKEKGTRNPSPHFVRFLPLLGILRAGANSLRSDKRPLFRKIPAVLSEGRNGIEKPARSLFCFFSRLCAAETRSLHWEKLALV